jgi:uncharacterized protein (TIGR01244 family)
MVPSSPCRNRPRATAALLLTLALVAPLAVADAAPVDEVLATELLPNGRAPLPGVATGGEPSQAQLEAIAAHGFRTVVSLRTDAEGSEIEAPGVEGLGMRYAAIPVAGADGLTRAAAEALDRILDDPEAGPVAIFCGSGNRVGALLALRAAWLEGATPEEALRLGTDAGLTGLEPAVRSELGSPW